MESREIEKELSKLMQRRVALTSDMDAANAALATARTSLIAGEPKSLGTLTSEQARTTALAEAIIALDGQISAKRTELAKVQAAEDSAANTARLRALTEARAQAEQDYFAARAELHAQLAEPIANIRAAFKHWRDLTLEAQSLGARVGDRMANREPEGIFAEAINTGCAAADNEEQRQRDKVLSQRHSAHEQRRFAREQQRWEEATV